MQSRVDVVVVGAGIMGVAAARVLARSGRRVVCLEQFEIGHKRGSSHGTSRIFRLAYEDADYIRLAREALPLWRELERETGEPLLETTGSLDVGGDLGAFYASLLEGGIEAEILDSRGLRNRFPALHLPEQEALFHREGGVLHADRAWRALVAPVDVVQRTRVDGIADGHDGVALSTADGTIRAGAAIVAAGPWAPALLELPVTVTRETVVHFRLRGNGLPTLIDRAQPDVAVVAPNQATYALASPGIGLKVGIHRSGERADPDEDGTPDDGVVAAVTAWARERYVLSDRGPALVETCLYTSTDDERFLIERHGRVVVCSACSGHGFKFAPLLGRRIAGLVEEALAG